MDPQTKIVVAEIYILTAVVYGVFSLPDKEKITAEEGSRAVIRGALWPITLMIWLCRSFPLLWK